MKPAMNRAMVRLSRLSLRSHALLGSEVAIHGKEQLSSHVETRPHTLRD